jgi:hypothetical protein
LLRCCAAVLLLLLLLLLVVTLLVWFGGWVGAEVLAACEHNKCWSKRLGRHSGNMGPESGERVALTFA